jgi:hypothetical protein
MYWKAIAMRRFPALLVLSLAPVLVAVAPAPLSATSSADVTAPLVTAVALAAWTCSTWLLLVVVVTFGARLPGAAGRAAHRFLLHVAPTSVRSLVRAAVGAGVAASVLAGPALAYADGTPPQASSSSYEWPGGASAQPVIPVPASLDWPGASPHATPNATPSTTPTATPRATPRATPGAVRAPASRPRHAPLHLATRGGVVVQTGDSLWEIAARDLAAGASDAQVAQAWPRWWSANRVLIGDDPSLIHPGDLLIPPTP